MVISVAARLKALLRLRPALGVAEGQSRGPDRPDTSLRMSWDVSLVAVLSAFATNPTESNERLVYWYFYHRSDPSGSETSSAKVCWPFSTQTGCGDLLRRLQQASWCGKRGQKKLSIRVPWNVTTGKIQVAEIVDYNLRLPPKIFLLIPSLPHRARALERVCYKGGFARSASKALYYIIIPVTSVFN